MKKQLYSRFLICLLFLIPFSSCQKISNLDRLDTAQNELNEFPINEVKSFFNTSIGTPPPVVIPGTENLTKSNYFNINQTLDWNSYITYQDSHSSIYEIPLEHQNSLQGALIKSKEKGVEIDDNNVTIQSHLVIQKFKKNNHIRYFVVTAIGKVSTRYKPVIGITPFNYSGDRKNFEGYLIFSNEAGVIQNVFHYNNGIRLRVELKHSSYFTDKPNCSLKGYAIKPVLTKYDIPWGSCYYCGAPWDDDSFEECCNGGGVIWGDPIYCGECQYLVGFCACCTMCRSYPCQSNCPMNNNGGCPANCGSYYCNGECASIGGGGGGSEGDYPNEDPITPDEVVYSDNKSEIVLKPLLESIYKDCAGKNLMDGIGSLNVEYNEGITGVSVYNPSTKTIKWFYYGDLPEGILLHELIHAYQKQNGTYQPKNANIEVEAFLAQYKYCIKNGLELWDDYTKQITDAFNPYITNPTTENYNLMMKYVQNLDGYKDFIDYSENRNTNNLNTLFKCY